ncbi:VOC family protein [Glaciecola sp. KUL10]|uniref:VOC family protein n=1 Tax=Glaciecola sp. (strain KUL10) TaxID=2161813 RepID=UPI000D7853D3|nr:VOC family protein [Glaciecola sp. KUL10]GBL04970.1 bleomycin resistance protein [Glaciecola sp. KUL10]
MLSYATIGVTDLEKSEKFYTQLLAPLGAKTLVKMDRIIFIGKSMQEPMLSICIPYDEGKQHCGNGNMLAFAPGAKEKVDELYHKAIALGATCEGEPGQRIPDVFYGAYFRDFDGNKIAFNHFG